MIKRCKFLHLSPVYHNIRYFKCDCGLQPWYAKKAANALGEEEPQIAEEHREAPIALTAAINERQERREGRKGKQKLKDKKKDKDKKKERHKKSTGKHSKSHKAPAADLFAALRAEREAREAHERTRANQAVLDATFNADG